MKKLLFISAMISLSVLTANAQDDDMYFTPSKKAKQEAKEKYIQEQEAKEKAAREQEARIRALLSQQTYYCGSDRDVDEYNRRSPVTYSASADSTGYSHQIITRDSTAIDTFDFHAGNYTYSDSLQNDSMMQALRNSEDYKYSKRMARFDDGKPVNIYVENNYDPWYDDSWYYGWYGPYYRRWWYWDAWYDPWFYGPGWGYYSLWYGPRWYGPGWYRPGWVGPINRPGRVTRVVSGRYINRGREYNSRSGGSRGAYNGYSGGSRSNTYGGGSRYDSFGNSGNNYRGSSFGGGFGGNRFSGGGGGGFSGGSRGGGGGGGRR